MVRKKSKQGAHLKGASTSRFNGENKSSRDWLDAEDDAKDSDFVDSDGAEDEPDDTSDDEMTIETAQTLRARAGRTSAVKRLKTTHTPPPGPRLRQGDIFSAFFSRAAAGTPSAAAVASDAAAGATPTTILPTRIFAVLIVCTAVYSCAVICVPLLHIYLIIVLHIPVPNLLPRLSSLPFLILELECPQTRSAPFEAMRAHLSVSGRCLQVRVSPGHTISFG